MPGDTPDSSVSRFLADLSDLLVDLGPRGFRLARASLPPPHEAALAYSPTPPVLPPASSLFPIVLRAGQEFSSRVERRKYYWQPAAFAPGYLHVAWIINELHNEFPYFAEEDLTLQSINCDNPRYLDLSLIRPSGPVTVRIQVEDRTDPLDYPAMAIREHLAENPSDGQPLIQLDI